MSLQKLRQHVQSEGWQAFLITEAHNRRYLSGFTGSAGVLLITPAEQFIITDFRYYEQVKLEAPDWQLIQAGYHTTKYLQEVLEERQLHQGSQIGFEADHVTVSQLREWQESLEAVTFVETKNIVQAMRAAKSEAEIAILRRAVALTDQAMAHIYAWMQPGMTEKEVAWEVESYLRTQGADGLAFALIVASGPNGALPHAHPTDRPIQLGDVVIIDMGCMIDGYCSDLTRTFSLGEPSHPEYLKVWQTVSEAVEAAKVGIKAGFSGKEADALARAVIEAAGYGDQFGHSLGHGVGLAIHEGPRASYAHEDTLNEDAVITLEPGIYIPDAFGIRLEDMVVVTPEGVEVLTHAPKVPVLER